MLTTAIKSNVITLKDDIITSITASFCDTPLQNKDILVVTSKVAAITQGRVVKIESEEQYKQLVEDEADKIYGGEYVTLTKKNNIFIAWAGIDRSNVEPGHAVLWPEKPYELAHQIWEKLKLQYKIDQLGVVITDSHCHPLRKGVTAVAIGYAGFHGVRDLRGKEDLYKNKLEFSQQGIADALATSAHLVMGESNEQTPFALIKDAPVTFTEEKIDPQETTIPAQDCIFSPIYKTTD